MNNTINPAGLTLTQPSTTSAKPAPGDAEATSGARGAATAVQGDDQVQLTQSARAMGAAGQGADAPVDSQRVERIRQAIAHGAYKIDPQSVADHLIALERQLG